MQFVYKPTSKKTAGIAKKARKIAEFYERGFSEEQISELVGYSVHRVELVCAEYRGQKERHKREQTKNEVITLKMGGMTPKNIAKKVGLEVTTVRRYITEYYNNTARMNKSRRKISEWRIERRLKPIWGGCYQ